MGAKNKEHKERRKTISCGTLVYRFGETWDDTCILLVKQFAHKDSWGIPKGHMHEGETPEQCATRETREEAGIDVILEDRLPDAYAGYKHEDKTVVSYLAQQSCSRVPDASDPDSEVADARWFRVGELPIIHAYQRALIAEAVNRLHEAFHKEEG
jgi:8-oxo-dGTP pyrophosphatase MutT (NUDIX family)